MNIYEAAVLAQTLINDHGLAGWVFQLDRAKRRAGICRQSKKIISLSENFIEHNELDEVKDTILHEIAHDFHSNGQGLLRCVGRLSSIHVHVLFRVQPEHVKMPQGNWQAFCSTCQKIHSRHRKPKYNLYHCKKCKTTLVFGRTTAVPQ